MSRYESKKAIISPDKAEIQSRAGSFPDPETLKGYADIDASFPERLLKMAEKEQEHNFKFNNQLLEDNRAFVKGEQKLIIISNIIGACLLVICFILAFISAYLKFHYLVSLAFLSVPVMTVIFEVVNKSSTKKTKSKKN